MRIALKYIACIAMIITTFIACDKEFTSIDSDIINPENAANFNTDRQVYNNNILAYTKKLGPVQTNTIPASPVGVYTDPVYGTTTYSLVTQISSTLIDPDFGEDVDLDSVVLTIPYFSTNLGVDNDGNPVFELDSVFNPENPVKISIFENTYFLRDFDPNSDFNENQNYFSNQSSSISDPISQNALEGPPIQVSNQSNVNLNVFTPSSSTIELKDAEGNTTDVLAPSFRVKLDNDFWQEKIFDKQGEPELSNANNFANYFRGLYFKVEPVNGVGNLMLLNFAATNANVTMYYTKEPFTAGEERDEVTFVMNFNGNRASFLENNLNLNPEDGDEENGDANLFLKGGEGSIAYIDLFNGTDVDENPEENEFELFKSEFVNVDSEGNYESRKRLINEANLVFRLDESFFNSQDDVENTRLFLYDADNNRTLIDYIIDTESGASPFNSRIEHLGQLRTIVNEFGEEEKVYKFNITQHIGNLLTSDSTNVRLGLSVSNNVNLEGAFPQPNVQLTSSTTVQRVPISSVQSQRGTVLIGNAHPDENKRVFLEIYYSEPEGNEEPESED